MDTGTSSGDSAPSRAVIRLNIGGSLFSTTKQTLLREENSIFAQVLNAELEGFENSVFLLSDGTLFIDRNGFLFAYILEYLRLGKLILPENFHDLIRLREEARFYRLENLEEQILNLSATKNIPVGDGALSNPAETGGYITIGYRGTFAFGRDGQADVKFRKLHRILVCGKVALCREVFGDTLNESRDPDHEGQERYTSRLYLKHQSLEKACDTLAEKGFKLVATCCSGANGLIATNYGIPGTGLTQQEFVNQRNTGEYEEQRWAHYTEYVFYREALFSRGLSPSPFYKTCSLSS